MLTLGTFATQYALSSVRYDLLPVALGALGLAAVARGPTRRAIGAAAVLFALAFAAKPTALTAPAAAVAWLLVRRERRAALALGAIVGALAVAVVGTTDALSGGRFLALLGATASGGARLRDLRGRSRPPRPATRHLGPGGDRAPRRGVRGRPRRLPAPRARRAPRRRRPGAVARVLARRGARRDPRRLRVPWHRREPPRGARGRGGARARRVMARARHGGQHRARARAGRGRARRRRRRRDCAPGSSRTSRLAELRSLAAALPPGVVFSEDPLLPIVAGQRPLVLDGFMLRLAADRDPAIARPLLDGLRRDEFAAVVLLQDLDSPEARGWYRRGNLGLEVVGEVARHYRLSERFGRYHLYLPSRAASGEGPVAAAAAERRSGARPAFRPVPARAPEIPASSAALGARATP